MNDELHRYFLSNFFFKSMARSQCLFVLVSIQFVVDAFGVFLFLRMSTVQAAVNWLAVFPLCYEQNSC